ncbi:unnamed protein product [Rotaria sordida]|uniref:Uncharacterized protein n=1 Tax=Rotaria sordida TaxID=392033 RepID=A0A819VTK0_9BILA|nr:unnamed protein product [Rotaria sordida]CAF4113719.1 unnamed protein product [Rotaria sordida]
MLLLSKRNSVPFLQPSLKNSSSYRFVSDIIHVWNYSIPIILSFGIGLCSGKSTTINNIFLSSFEQSSSSIYFQNTIDIDFGYSFLPSRSMSIADAHVIDQLKIIMTQGKYLLLIIRDVPKESNIDQAIIQLNQIIENQKHQLTIIRDTPPDNHLQHSSLSSSKYPTIRAYFLPDISNQGDRINRNHIITLRNQI